MGQLGKMKQKGLITWICSLCICLAW